MVQEIFGGEPVVQFGCALSRTKDDGSVIQGEAGVTNIRWWLEFWRGRNDEILLRREICCDSEGWKGMKVF